MTREEAATPRPDRLGSREFTTVSPANSGASRDSLWISHMLKFISSDECSTRRQHPAREGADFAGEGVLSHGLEPRRRGLVMELERHCRSGESPTLQRLKCRTEEKLPDDVPGNAQGLAPA